MDRRTVVLATDGSAGTLRAPRRLASELEEEAEAIVAAERRALEAAGIRDVIGHVICGAARRLADAGRERRPGGHG
jgi:hypothetical protein